MVTLLFVSLALMQYLANGFLILYFMKLHQAASKLCDRAVETT